MFALHVRKFQSREWVDLPSDLFLYHFLYHLYFGFNPANGLIFLQTVHVKTKPTSPTSGFNPANEGRTHEFVRAVFRNARSIRRHISARKRNGD